MKIGILAPFNPYVIRERFRNTDTVPDVNKSASAINVLVKEYLDQGLELVVFTYVPDHSFVPVVLNGPNVRVYVLSSKFFLPKAGVFMRLFMVPRLRKVVNKEVDDLDVLHAHWTYDYALATKRFEKRLPVFCTVRDWCPVILKQQVTLKMKAYWLVSYYVFKRVMHSQYIHFIANSEYTRDMISKHYPTKEVSISYNPIEKELILTSRTRHISSPIFISVAGSVDNPGKNIFKLLLAFKVIHRRHPNTELIVVGTRPSESFIHDCVINNVLDGVCFTGFIRRSEIVGLIDESYCLVHPSLEETFGNIFLEAMARRVPTIGGLKSGAVPYILGNGKFGLLCDVTNVDSLIEAMEKILDKNIADGLVNFATDHMITNYSSDIVVNKLLSEYKKFL